MPSGNDPEIGIDKQKIVREIAQQAPTDADADAAQSEDQEQKSRGPQWVHYVRSHADEISSLVILSVAFLWILGGILAQHNVPILIGAAFIVPGVLGLAQRLRR